MKKKFDDQYNMLLAVETQFDTNAPIWTSNIPISDAKTALSGLIDQITTVARQQKVTSTGMTMDKAALRTDLETKGIFLSSALSGYASANAGQVHLFKNVHIAKSEFAKLRGADLLETIDNLKDAAISVMENLAPYGVTAATLTELTATRVALHEILKMPEQIISDRKDATDAIPVLLHQATALLEKTMDNLIETLRAVEPHFVNVYFNVRKIHNTGERTLSLETTVLDATNNIPLAKVHIEIVGQNIKRISTEKGQNRVQNLKEGNYTLSVNHLGFVPQMIPFMVISGETTQIVIEMQKEVSEILSN